MKNNNIGQYVVNSIAVIAGLIAIASLWVKPEIIGNWLADFISSSTFIAIIFRYSKLIVFLPIFTGILYSRRFNGFTRLFNPLHIIASFIMWEYWVGFEKGLKIIGYVAIPLSIVIIFI